MAKQPKVYDSYWDRYRAKHPPKGPPMQHFRYVDIIRRPDGTLRPWKEHDILARYDAYCNEARRDERSFVKEARKIIESEIKWK